ncbi:MAG: LysR family transcriptional regulator [Maricaulaceae bacterium]|nr:LysR family transcriptional regulator [Maricaulaceae bacterium]
MKDQNSETALHPVSGWEGFEAFNLAARTGSVQAAAAALGCSGAEIEARIRGMERRLGTTLLLRTGDSVSLTPAGQTALGFVGAMQDTAARMREHVGGLEREAKGQVKLNFSDGLATFWLARKVADFLEANPGIALDLSCGEADTALADLSIAFQESTAMDVSAEPLGVMHYMPFTSSRYIERFGAPETVQDLLSARFLKVESYRRDRGIWNDSVSAIDASVHYGLQTNVSSVLFEAIRHGGGIAMGPTFLAELYPDDLVVIDCGVVQPVQFWLTRRNALAQAARVQAVANWVKSCFAPAENPWFRREFVHPKDFSNARVMKLG